MKLVVDHLGGSRRGARQVFELDDRIRIGRHPDCEIAFDSHRDLDASSRHAEIRRQPGGELMLSDIGSSNGTYVDGARVTRVSLTPGEAVRVEFGVGGPVVRLFVGDEAQVAALPEPDLEPPPRPQSSSQNVIIGVLIALISAALVAIWWRFVD